MTIEHPTSPALEAAKERFLWEQAGQLELRLTYQRSRKRKAATKAREARHQPLCRKAMLGTGRPCARNKGHSGACDTIGDWPAITADGEMF